jgi:hypothetical protein
MAKRKHPPARFRWAARENLIGRDTRMISTCRPCFLPNGWAWWRRQRDVGTPAQRVSREQLIRLLGHDLAKGTMEPIEPPLSVPWSAWYRGPARAATLAAIRARAKEEADG